jgi:hypothetical protein
MRCLPRIDRPCPLDSTSQREVGNFCAHCDRTVHQLDAMSAEQRRDLFRASGPICVSYRLAAGMGAALAFAFNPAQAAPPPVEPTPWLAAPQAERIPSILIDAGESHASPLASPVVAPPETGECEEELTDIVIVGGVSDPRSAQWIEDDRSLPDLPRVALPRDED